MKACSMILIFAGFGVKILFCVQMYCFVEGIDNNEYH